MFSVQDIRSLKKSELVIYQVIISNPYYQNAGNRVVVLSASYLISFLL